LADYDLPLLESDLTDLEKRGYVQKDGTDGKYVAYIGILSQVRPKNLTGAQQSNLMLRAIVRIQSVWRAKKARRELAARRRAGGLLGADEVGGVIEALRNNDPAQLAKATKGQKTEPKKEKEVKKSARTADLEAKMAAVIRPDKGGKVSDKVLQARKEMSEFLRKTVLEHCIEAAFCYGESLEVCRTIQKRFENRPVTKYLFPMLQEFQFGVQGVLPKSLANVNALGQVMVLDDSN
jgi:Ca2+-binding EF-hand superfamily protein